MERKLASIQTILTLTPIPDADRIELATVQGWQSVVKKGDFKVGDMVIYCECDSILPFAPWNDFLRDKKNLDKPIRIKPIRLKKVLSQGIILPIDIIKTMAGCINQYHTDHEVFEYNNIKYPIQEGTDVTTLLGITKYEIPDAGSTDDKPKGGFPSWLISVTDESRMQSFMDIIHEFHGKPCYITVKLDGSSWTLYKHMDDFGVCSRNLNIKENENSRFWYPAFKYDLKNKLANGVKFIKTVEGGVQQEVIINNIALQGEACGKNSKFTFDGSGVYKNPLGLPDVDVFIFNVKNLETMKYLDYDDMVKVINALGLKRPPVVTDQFKFDKNIHTPEYFYKMMENMYYEGSTNHIEGIVIRSIVECRSEVLKDRLSMKIINPLYEMEKRK